MAKPPTGMRDISTTYQTAYATYDGNVQVRKIGDRLWEVLPRGGAALYEKSKAEAIERAFQLSASRSLRSFTRSGRASNRSASSHARVLRSSSFGGVREVRGPAVHLVQLPVGAKDKHGDPITRHTPDWARLSQEKIADDVRLEGARESGHDIEGHVRIKGKRYSAFTSGGPDDFVIVVRNYKGKS